MSRLPTWAAYLITAMGAIIMALSGITLIKVDKTLTNFEVFIKTQVEYNQEIKESNKEIKSFVFEICKDLTLNHEQRMDKYRMFPLIPK